jgi:hypothetical protein
MSQARPVTRRMAAPAAAAAGAAGPRLGLALLIIATAQLMVLLDATWSPRSPEPWPCSPASAPTRTPTPESPPGALRRSSRR